MKIKIYGWSEDIRKPKDPELSMWRFELIPSVGLHSIRTDFAAENMFDKKPSKGLIFAILCSWLLWGFAVEFRFGDDAKEKE